MSYHSNPFLSCVAPSSTPWTLGPRAAQRVGMTYDLSAIILILSYHLSPTTYELSSIILILSYHLSAITYELSS